MSNFKKTVTNLVKEKEEFRIAAAKGEEEKLDKNVNKFCAYLREHIKEKAKNGEYVYDSANHAYVISGVINAYDVCSDFEGLLNIEISNIEKEQCNCVVDDTSKDSLVTTNTKSEKISILHFLNKERSWIKELKLSYSGSQYVSYIKNNLEKDNICFSHAWLVKTWQRVVPEYGDWRCKGKLLSAEVLTEPEITVKKE